MQFVDDDEELISLTIQVTRAEAFNGPNRVQWMQADDLEKLQIEGFNTWRDPLPGELRPGDEVIPC